MVYSECSVQISRAAYYLPERRVTLAQMSKIAGVPGEIIADKIGIEEKRVAGENEHPSDMAVMAAREALKGVDPQSINAIIYCGATPVDYPFWVCAHKVQEELELTNAFVFDLNAICAGSVYAIVVAKSLIMGDPSINRILIAGGEKFSSICTAKTYENLSALRYADGGGAMLLERGNEYNEVLASHFVSKGELNSFVKVPAGGTVLPASQTTVADDMHSIQCSDTDKLKAIFSETYVETYRKIIQQSMKKSGLEQSVPDYLVLNQTDSRSTRKIVEVLGFDENRMISTRRKLGHIGIVDQIMIWKMLHEQKPLKAGDAIVLASSGVGFSWGAVSVRFLKNFSNA